MSNRKIRILIIDDEVEFQNELDRRLKNAGYDALSASDGFHGLEKARNDHPDLIVLDAMLPKMSGYKVSRLLKFDETYKHIPILMVNARAEEADKKLGMETGADAYFTKPCNYETILETIGQLLKSKGLS